ncbi:MAG: transglycosylase SLT domain-containing protein [Deltaproteobacteria bacterium]|nr:transglycosylase SLT domain-containing protein [Deltaproteobacteria bacterium]
MPATGFWMNANDQERGICAVRMRIDLAAAPGLPTSSAATRESVNAGNNALPLSLDRARYRATLRDMPKHADDTVVPLGPEPKTMISLYGDQVALALDDATYLPLRRISAVKPSQRYQYWTERGTFLPADGKHRAADPANIRWLTDAGYKPGGECLTTAETSIRADMQRLLFRIKTPVDLYAPHPKSAQYMEHIEHAATRFGLSPRLIYAIMRTESAFNPFAVSNAGALGLMQVVPDSAGGEVQAYLTGKTGKPSVSFLFDPKSNIEYGSAYLHLLATRYFSGVTNPTSRELCMIAGYNAGPRAVFRAFGTNNQDAAINAINELSPDELYTKLSRHMPAEETRQYVGKVVAAFNSYPG